MKITRRETLGLMGSALVVAGAGASVAFADAHEEPKVIEVEMLNKDPESGERMVFSPDLIRANPGDTIRFLPTDRGHNSASTEDMMPEGAEEWKGKIGDEIEVVVEKDGTYGFHCTPHLTLGMVGLILVGDAMVNFEDARGARQRGKAKARYEDIFARAEAMLAEEKAA